MTQRDLIKLLAAMAGEYGKRIFSLREFALLCRETEAASGMALLRAEREGIVGKVKNLWFNKLDKPSLEALALALRSPTYISFESALYTHGILSQSPRGALMIATTGRGGSIETPLGSLRYIHLAEKYFFGFDAQRTALPEKALLDMIYAATKTGTGVMGAEVLYLEHLNKRRLRAFAEKFPRCIGNKIRALRNIKEA